MDGEKTIEWRFRIHHLHAALLAAAAFLMALTRPPGPSIWRHLAAGRYILEAGSIPGEDVFSFTASPSAYAAWLFGVIVSRIEAVGGMGLLVLAQAAIFAASIALLSVACIRRSDLRSVSIVVVALAALASRSAIALRPELFTWLLIPVLLILLDRFMDGRRRPLCLFPLLMLLWVNIDPLAVVGLAILGIPLLGEIACRLMPAQAESNGWRRLGNRGAALLALVLAASFVACMCTPSAGGRLLPSPGLFAAPAAAEQPPLFQYPWFAAFLLLAVFTLVMFMPIMEPADTMLLVVSGLLSVASARNAPLLPVCASPLIAAQFARLAGMLPRAARDSVARWRRGADAALALLLAALAAWSLGGPDPDTGDEAIPPPEGAARYVLESGPAPQLFNAAEWGGYLAWRLIPRYRVFIDAGSPPPPDPGVLAAYRTVELARDGWEEVLDRYGVNLMILPTAGRFHALIDRLGEAHGWRLVYWDARAMVFVRDIPANAPLVAARRHRALRTEGEFGFREWRPEHELQLTGELRDYLKAHPERLDARNLLAVHYLRAGALDRAFGEFEKVATLQPGVRRVHYNLAMLAAQRGDMERAKAEYEREIAADAEFPPAHNNLGRIFYEAGDLARAAACFREALRIEPRYVHAMNNLGLVLLEEGRVAEAAGEFGRALAIDPRYGPAAANLALAREMAERPVETYNRLGQMYYGAGNLRRAEEQFRKALAHDPRYTVAINNLGVISLQRGAYREAISRFHEVLVIDPSDRAARANLAIAESLVAAADVPGE
ncbi:MAG: tetratricopeptide repeat protein [bacterium]|nr:tetratricopeptide repeat protein [bacterium]